MKRFVILFFGALCISVVSVSYAQNSARFEKWQKPSFYRGFNFTENSHIKVQQDFLDYAKTGATFVYICCDGFRTVLAPYSPDQNGIQITDNYISYCHAAGLHYAINLRQGPGRRNVWDEGQPGFSKSTIWKNSEEQKLYASTLREIVQRYKDDSLFIGISPITEPNPLFDNFYFDTASLKKILISNNIDLQSITQLCVDSIRSVSKDIPILIQGPAYSSPEFIPLSPKINDPFIIYEFHSYRPHEYVYATDTSTLAYPGNYISYIQLKIAWFNKTYLKDTVFRYIYDRHHETGAPIFLGEFGLEFPQTGGAQFLNDLASIATENGWHFAWWNYRGPPNAWDYEIWQPQIWTALLKSFEGNSSVTTNHSASSKITLSPNPCSSNVIVRIFGASDPKKLSVYDVLGHKIKEAAMQNNFCELNTEGFTSGEYLVVVQSGTEVMAKGLVVVK